MARVDVVKWVAPVIQLIGYGLTGLNIVLWNDRAIMVVHVGALIAIVGGYLGS